MLNHNKNKDKGFVLMIALMVIALASLLAASTFLNSTSAVNSSSSAQKTTQAFYYAESGINYISWALANDAEFDSAIYTGNYQSGAFTEPTQPTSSNLTGDLTELNANTWNPGPTSIDNTASGTSGQVRYFDNSPMASRYLCFDDSGVFSNCVNPNSTGATASPVMHDISSKLPRYIKLEIDTNGNVTPSIPQLPHRSPPVTGEDIPVNGAIVWLTAGDPVALQKDIEIFPLDPLGTNGLPTPASCTAGQLPNCPCDYTGNNGGTAIDLQTSTACNAHANGDANQSAAMGGWISTYRIVAYAIGYVDGKPSQLLRSVIR